MLSNWLRNRRRRRLLAAPFPARWESHLQRTFPYERTLTDAERSRLRDAVRVFIAEKYWEGCGGLRLRDEMKVTIAAHACLMILNLPNDHFPNVRSVFVYPHHYRARERRVGPDGVVTEGRVIRSGEAWDDGPVVLSWRDVVEGLRDPHDGVNVVFHEFAHKLDMTDRHSDGTPLFGKEAERGRWVAVVTEEYEALVRQSASGEATLLDRYGAESYSEFFAVATETFFERPRALRRRHPRLYEVLRDYFRQDPAARTVDIP